MILKRIFTLIFLSTILFGCSQNTEPKEILFVCTHGAARSPIGAAFFNKIAAEQDLNYYAVFRGTEPDENLTTETIVGLTKDNIEIDGWKPKKVSTDDISNAYRIVTFDCTLPENDSSESNQEQWNGTPSISKDYETARDVIIAKVERLIETLPKD